MNSKCSLSFILDLLYYAIVSIYPIPWEHGTKREWDERPLFWRFFRELELSLEYKA